MPGKRKAARVRKGAARDTVPDSKLNTAREEDAALKDRFGPCLLAAWLLAACSLPLRAQMPAPANAQGEKEPEKPAARGQAAVERAEPDIYYIRDESGELVPLMNFPLEDLKRLMALREGSPRGAFRLERFVGHAEVVGDYATVAIEMVIAVTDEGWVRVPLRMGNLVLSELPKWSGSGERLVDFDADSRDYVVWFRGKAEEPHQLSLRGLVNLETDSGQRRFKLSVPRAVFSELELTVPKLNAVGQVSGGVLADTDHSPERTQFRVSGLSSDFALAWHAVETERTRPPTALSVEGQIISTVDGGGVDSTATLTVSAFGREFDSFQVRLPPGATLLPADAPDYSVSELPSSADDVRKLVEVRLKTKTALPTKVKLETKQGHDVTREGTFELGGFDCLGAVRQSGHLAVKVEDDWQVTFVRRQGVLQSDNLPPEMHGDVVAGFLYFGQPFSLPVHVTPRQTRTSVEPAYVVRVSPHHLELDATFKYHVAGAKIFTLSLDLNGWQLDVAKLEPAALINTAALVSGVGGAVLIPLKQPTTGELEMKFRATRPLAEDAKAFDFGLPRPSADVVATKQLVVLADDNVVLEPRINEASGFSSSTLPSDQALPPHRQAAWTYQADLPDPRFAADFRVAPRRLTLRAHAQVSLTASAAKIEETLFGNVSHEALESLLLLVPTVLANGEELQVRYQGTALALEPATADQAADDQPATVRVHLPQPVLGPFELTVAYMVPDADLASLLSRSTTMKLDLPLVMPGEGEFTQAAVNIAAEPPVEVKLVDPAWEAERGAKGTLGTLAATSIDRPQTIALGISPLDSAANDSLVVERAWVQTWLTHDQRIERAVFRFQCRNERLALRLPPGISADRYRLDDKIIAADTSGDSSSERILTLPSADSSDETHVLEVTYEVPRRPGEWGRLVMAMPSLINAAGTHPIYWQVLLPHDEFLFTGPSALSSEFSWVWQTVSWVRRPLRETADLEFWSGSRVREEPLPQSLNAYLFSGMSLPESVEIVTVSRVELMLFCSGAVLALGMMWIYIPALRRAAWLFAVFMLVLSASAAWPDMALLFVQAGVLGVVLVVLAAALERRMSQPQRQTVFRSGPSSIVGRSGAHTPARAVPTMPASTRSAAIAMELEAEAKP